MHIFDTKVTVGLHHILTKHDAVFVSQNSTTSERSAIDLRLGSNWRRSNFIIAVNDRDDGVFLEDATITGKQDVRRWHTREQQPKHSISQE